MRPVIDGVFEFTGLLMGRAYAIPAADGLTLIDTGLSRMSGRILSQLRAAGYAPTDVKRILLTHTHFDHAGGLHAIQQASGAQVFVSALEADTVRGTAELPRPAKTILPQQFIPATPIHRELHDGDYIPDILGGLMAIATPGHTFGHLSFWSPTRKILFTGDVILHTLGIALPLPVTSVDMAINAVSVKKIAALEPEALLFGHGPAITTNAAQRLHDFVTRRKL